MIDHHHSATDKESSKKIGVAINFLDDQGNRRSILIGYKECKDDSDEPDRSRDAWLNLNKKIVTDTLLVMCAKRTHR